MPIRSFDSLVASANLARTTPLNTLHGNRIGIDLEYWLSKMTLQPLWPSLISVSGHFPAAIESELLDLVFALTSNNIEPVFVLGGLDSASTSKSVSITNMQDKQIKKAESAWPKYKEGNKESAARTLAEVVYLTDRPTHSSPQLPPFEWTNRLVRFLARNCLKYFVASSTATAQLFYLYSNDYINAIFADSDAYLFPIEQLITWIDTKSQTITYILLSTVLAALRMPPATSHECFVEIALAAGGTGVSPKTFPALESIPMASVATLKCSSDLLLSYPSIYNAVYLYESATPPSQKGYLNEFQKALAMCRFPPVITDSGAVEPIHKDKDNPIPQDLHDYIGQRLPDEYYFYMSRGLISPRLLSTLSSGSLKVRCFAFDNTPSLSKFVSSHTLHDLRAKTLNLLTQPIHRFFQFKQYQVVYWSGQSSPIPRMDPLCSKLKHWKLDKEQFPAHDKSTDAHVHLDRLFFTLENELPATSYDPTVVLTDDSEIMNNAILRALDLLGLTAQDPFSLTGTGKQFVRGLKLLRHSALSELLLLLFLLHRSEYSPFDSKTAMNIASSSPGTNLNDTDKFIMYLAFVSSLIPLRKHQPDTTLSLYDESLLKFRAFANTTNTALRDLIEACLVSLLANGDANRLARESLHEWNALAVELPYADLPSTCLGVVMKAYLEKLQSVSAPEEIEAWLNSAFPQAENALKDLEMALNLWDAFVAIIEPIGDSKSESSSNVMLLEADKWLKAIRGSQ